MSLDDIRKEIDAIDEQLIPLFKARMNCAKEVAKIKAKENIPVFNEERESQILDHMEEKAGEFGKEARLLYSTIMDTSRTLQHGILKDGKAFRESIQMADKSLSKELHIALPGVEGAFTHEVSEKLFPNATFSFYENFSDVFRAVDSEEIEMGVVPVENSAAGSVLDVYALILQYRFYIVEAATMSIHQCLAIPQDMEVTEETLTTVYSHPQGLAQCSDYLSARALKVVPYSNTAAAAQMVAEQGGHIAAICSTAAAKKYNLRILRKDIQNSSNNRTRFVAIRKRPLIPENAGKISVCFSISHKPGSLSSILSRFAMTGLNLTKIESKPIAGKSFEYDFYLDFTGNINQVETLDLIAGLQDELPRFSFLGNYEESLFEI